MSKNGRKNISFSEDDHARIVNAAREHGYTVSAGAYSQLGKFMLDCFEFSAMYANAFGKIEQEKNDLS